MDYSIKKRTIMIFPQFKNINMINEIREKYDPLSSHVRPHITLVFTFESSLTCIELKEHLERVLHGTSSFKLTLQGIVKMDNPLGQCHLDKGLSLSKPSKNIKNILRWLFLLLYMPKNNIFGHDK